MTTIKGIAKARWWLLLAAAILAYVVSGELAEYRNANLPPFEAMASVTFTEDPQVIDREDFEAFLDTQQLLATDVNSDVIGETPGAFIPWLMAEVDLETEANQLQFIGRGFTQEEANTLAETMQKNYLAVSTVGAGLEGMREDLETTSTGIGRLRDEIAALQAATPPTPDEVTQQTQRSVLENQVAALQAHLGNLTTQLMNPELVLRTPESIQAEMDRTLARLSELQNQLAGFPPVVDPAAIDQQDPVLTLKQLELQQLETRWNNLFTGILEQEALARQGTVDSRPVTLDAASTSSNQMLATIGAVAAALIGLVAIERGRGMMWSQKDLDEGPPVIVELPSRPLSVFHHPTTQPWYLDAQGGRRKAAIQMLRSQLDDYDDAVVAFQGSGVFKEDVRELTSDVAVAVAVSGRSVLLLDVSFDRTNHMVEWGPESGATLSSLLGGTATEREELISEFKSALLASPEVVHGLKAIRSGNGKRDAADVLSGYRFELLLEVAREVFDLVLISGTTLGEAASHVLAQRVDDVLLVASAGHTVTRSLEAADRDFAIRRATLLGVVLLRRRRTKVTRWAATGFRSWMWKTIDRFSQGKGEATDDTGEEADAIDDPGDEGGKGAHVKDDE
jgi:Mrp family chromosome partitioning ATPase